MRLGTTRTRSQIQDNLRRDLNQLLAPEGYFYAGHPNFTRLYGRDACITALQMLPERPDVARATLRNLARYQGSGHNRRREEEPGKIPHEVYTRPLQDRISHLRHTQRKLDTLRLFVFRGFPYYGTIDATAWWLILLGEYELASGDTKLGDELHEHAQRAVDWTLSRLDPFVEYERQNKRGGLRHQAWKDMLDLPVAGPVAMVEVQAYYEAALRLWGPHFAVGSTAAARRSELSTALHARFFLEETNYYAVALLHRDDEQVAWAAVTSNPGHLLRFSDLSPERARLITDRLFEDDLWTPYGIRTHSSLDAHFDARSYHQGSVWPVDNWIIWSGLKRFDFHEEAERVRDAMLRAYHELEGIPELYAVVDNKLEPLKDWCCPVQAWSAGALLDMLRAERA